MTYLPQMLTLNTNDKSYPFFVLVDANDEEFVQNNLDECDHEMPFVSLKQYDDHFTPVYYDRIRKNSLTVIKRKRKTKYIENLIVEKDEDGQQTLKANVLSSSDDETFETIESPLKWISKKNYVCKCPY